MADKKQKIAYVMQHVAENGFDTSKFTKFLKVYYSGPTTVDTMTMEQIVQAVNVYKNQNKKNEELLNRKDEQFVYKTAQQMVDKKVQESQSDPLSLDKKDEILYEKLKASVVDKSQPFQRKTQITKKIAGSNMTELNFKKVSVDIIDSEMVKAGIFAADYAEFTIQSDIGDQKFKVKRTDADFYTLRQIFSQIYPYIWVPYLPKQMDKEMAARAEVYNKFLQCAIKSEVLKSCKFLLLFLKITDKNYWQQEKNGYEKLKFSKRIEDVMHVDGQVSVEERSESKKYCEDVKNFNSVYNYISKEAIMVSKEVNDLSEQLGNSVNRLSVCIRDLGRLFKKVEVTSQSKLFTHLSELIKDSSINLKRQGYLMKTYINQAIKHQENQLIPFEDLVEFRDNFKFNYSHQVVELENKKNALFKKDPSKWGYTQGSMDDLVAKHQQLQKDKQQAFKYMLSAESQKTQEMGEELNFYTNQCLDEIRRVGKDNGLVLIDHFMDQGKIQANYLLKQSAKWHAFVNYFSNPESWDQPIVSRKKKTEKDEDFELLDDLDQEEELKPNQPIKQPVGQKEDVFEYVTQSKSHVRIAEVQITEELGTSKMHQQTSNKAKTVTQDIGETLKNLLEETMDDILQEKPSEKEISLQDVTEQLKPADKSSFLFQAPVVLVKKGKTSQYRRTAPLENIQAPISTKKQAITSTSNQGRMTSPFNTDSVESPDSKQQSNNSLPELVESEKMVLSDPVSSSSNNPLMQHTDVFIASSHSSSSSTPALVAQISHSSSSSTPALVAQMQNNQINQNKKSQQLFAFDLQTQHMSNLDQQMTNFVIPEESEKNSSEEPSRSNETLVFDPNQSYMPVGTIVGDGMKDRTQTFIITSQTNQQERREQTITDLIKPILEQKPKDKPDPQKITKQSISKPIPEEVQMTKKSDITPPVPKKFDVKKIIQQKAQKLQEESKMMVQNEETIEQILQSNRPSILSKNQIGKLKQFSQEDDDKFTMKGLPKLKPVVKENN